MMQPTFEDIDSRIRCLSSICTFLILHSRSIIPKANNNASRLYCVESEMLSLDLLGQKSNLARKCPLHTKHRWVQPETPTPWICSI